MLTTINYVQRWVFGSLFIILAVGISINALYRLYFFKKNNQDGVERNLKATPFIAPLLFVFGYSRTPLGYSPWLWLYILVDLDSLRSIYEFPFVLKEYFLVSRFNKHKTYVAQNNKRELKLKIYDQERFTIEIKILDPDTNLEFFGLENEVLNMSGKWAQLSKDKLILTDYRGTHKATATIDTNKLEILEDDVLGDRYLHVPRSLHKIKFTKIK